MGWREELRGLCEPCADRLQDILARVQQFNPNDWTAWVQLITSIIGVLWILYQFNKLREDAEERLEEYLAKHLDRKRRSLEEERRETFARFADDERLSIVRRTGRRAVAHTWRVLYMMKRLLPFIARPAAKLSAILLFDAGKKAEARDEFNRYGKDLLAQAKIYEDQAKAKKIEAGNSFLFAGRVAAQLNDRDGTKAAFNAVLNDVDQGDLDAHQLIGEQYRESDILKPALNEFEILATLAVGADDKARHAKALRLQADIHKRLAALGRARQALRDSLQIESARRNDRGLAETYEALGEMYAVWQPPAKRRARQSFESSKEHFRGDGDEDSALRIEARLHRLDNPETFEDWWFSRLLAWVGEFMLGAATRLRVRVQTT